MIIYEAMYMCMYVCMFEKKKERLVIFHLRSRFKERPLSASLWAALQLESLELLMLPSQRSKDSISIYIYQFIPLYMIEWRNIFSNATYVCCFMATENRRMAAFERSKR